MSDWHSKCFYRVSIKAVIFDSQGRVLVVKEEQNDDWNLPGGGMDYGESEYDALARELYEEVGMKGSFTYEPLGIDPMYLDQKQAWQLWIVYAVHPDNFKFEIGDQAQKIAFIDPAELEKTRPRVYKFASMRSAAS